MDNKIEPVNCTGSTKGGHSQAEYDTIGLSPCGEYVAHWVEKSCTDVEGIICHSDPDEIHNCQCADGVCPCGSFMSHKVFDICPLDIAK